MKTIIREYEIDEVGYDLYVFGKLLNEIGRAHV